MRYRSRSRKKKSRSRKRKSRKKSRSRKRLIDQQYRYCMKTQRNKRTNPIMMSFDCYRRKNETNRILRHSIAVDKAQLLLAKKQLLPNEKIFSDFWKRVWKRPRGPDSVMSSKQVQKITQYIINKYL